MRKSLKMVTVGFSVAAGALSPACGAHDTAAPGTASATPTTQAPAVGETKGKPAPSGQDKPDDTKVDNPDLRFPNTKQTVLLVGYNDKSGMVEFQTQRWVASGESQGYLDDVPGDTGTHRLPFTDDVTVRSALSICPTDQPNIDDEGLGAEKCTKQRLVTALREGQTFKAKIDVDGSDRISKVAEIYTP